MNSIIWIDFLGWALLHFLWQGVAAAGVLAVVLSISRTAAVRYWWAVGIICVLPLLPVVTVICMVNGGRTQNPLPMLEVRAVGHDSSPAVIPNVTSGRVIKSPKTHDPVAWVVVGWAIGAIGLGVVNLGGWVKVRRIARSGVVPADGRWQQRLLEIAERMGVRKMIRLLESSAVNSPAVVGHLRPIVLLPVSLISELSIGQIDMILAHELAHIRRGDFLINLVQAAIESLLFYHPAVWWISAQIRREREASCDAIAVAVCGGDSIAYARTLADLEDWRSMPRPAVGAAGAPVMVRVRRLLGLREPWRLYRCRSAMAGIVAAILVSLGAPWVMSQLLAAPPASQPDAAVRSIHILTAEGRPAMGARLTLICQADGGEDRALAEVVADAAGNARVPVEAIAKAGVNPRFVVDGDGCGIAVVRVEDQSASIQLAKAVPVTVTFIGPGNKPAVGVRVDPEFVSPGNIFEPHSLPYASLPPGVRERLGRVTDSAGKITFSSFGRYQQIRLAIADQRFAGLDLDLDELATGQDNGTPEKIIHLLPAAGVRGVVRFGPSGKPVVGVRVSAQGVEATRSWSTAVTDGRGEFEIRKMRPGRYNVALDLSYDLLERDWTAVAYGGLSVKAGEQISGKDFTLIAGVTVHGIASDAETHRPIAGAEIGIYGPAHPSSGGWVQTVTADAKGVFTAHVPAGKQYIYLMADVAGYTNPVAQWLTAVDGEPLNVRFAFLRDPTPQTNGQVNRSDGTAAVGATVLADRPGSTDPGPVEATTDSAGRFRLDSLPDGTLLRVHFGDGGTAGPVKLTRVNRDHLVITLAAGNTRFDLRVKVVDTDGKPISGAPIFLLPETLGPSSYERKNADAGGQVTFSEFYADQKYRLDVYREGYNEYQAAVKSLPIGSTNSVTIRLVRATGIISGRIANGPKDLGGVRVEMRGNFEYRHTLTDASGQFHFDHVDTGTMQKIRAVADWGSCQWRAVKANDTGVEIRFDYFIMPLEGYDGVGE